MVECVKFRKKRRLLLKIQYLCDNYKLLTMNARFFRHLALLVVVLFTASLQLHAEGTKPRAGDVNGDGQITVTDVMLMVNYITGRNMTGLSFSEYAADPNRDNRISVTDVMIVVKIILGTPWDDPDNPTLHIDDGEGEDPGGGL